MTETVDVVVIGGGPAGLRAAADLAGDHSVILLERERDAGGIPRHSHHTGYGLRDLRRVMTGPRYAAALVERALASGVQMRTSSMVTGWHGPRAVEVSAPTGRSVVEGRAVLLATGARERPRAARWIPGDRPAGVMTTGQLQQMVHLQHRSIGSRAVILGSELVSWSAVLTLREAGCTPVAMVTASTHQESYAALAWAGRTAFRLPVLQRTRVMSIEGDERVTGVTVIRDGRVTTIACDTVITSGDWIPDHELARLRGISMNAGSKAPVSGADLSLTDDGVFGAGNLLHPVDTADVCALDGAHVARSIRAWLAHPMTPRQEVEITAGSGLAWVTPGRWQDHASPARGRLLAWPEVPSLIPTIVARQGGHDVGRRRLPWPAAPGRMLRIPAAVLAHVQSGGGPVELSLR